MLQKKSPLSFLRHNRIGATLLELMAMLLIVTLSLTTMFHLLSESLNFARNSEARIKATALAREGVEAMLNIRNTNWLRYPSNRTNCWNTLNYDKNCLTSSSWSKIEDGDYKIYKENGLWKLAKSPQLNPADFFDIGITENGVYSASGGSENQMCTNFGAPGEDSNKAQKNINCKTIFTRRIKIQSFPNSSSSTGGILATSIVEWKSPRGGRHSVKIPIEIYNWKSNYER